MKLYIKVLILFIFFFKTHSVNAAVEPFKTLRAQHLEALNFSPTATPTKENIKTTYKKLALQYHPDKNKSPDAEAIFKTIANANDFFNLSEAEQARKEAIHLNWYQERNPSRSAQTHSYSQYQQPQTQTQTQTYTAQDFERYKFKQTSWEFRNVYSFSPEFKTGWDQWWKNYQFTDADCQEFKYTAGYDTPQWCAFISHMNGEQRNRFKTKWNEWAANYQLTHEDIQQFNFDQYQYGQTATTVITMYENNPIFKKGWDAWLAKHQFTASDIAQYQYAQETPMFKHLSANNIQFKQLWKTYQTAYNERKALIKHSEIQAKEKTKAYLKKQKILFTSCSAATIALYVYLYKKRCDTLYNKAMQEIQKKKMPNHIKAKKLEQLKKNRYWPGFFGVSGGLLTLGGCLLFIIAHDDYIYQNNLFKGFFQAECQKNKLDPIPNTPFY